MMNLMIINDLSLYKTHDNPVQTLGFFLVADVSPLAGTLSEFGVFGQML